MLKKLNLHLIVKPGYVGKHFQRIYFSNKKTKKFPIKNIFTFGLYEKLEGQCNIPSPKGLGLLIIFFTCKDSIRFIN
jgi:hypothetical protein